MPVCDVTKGCHQSATASHTHTQTHHTLPMFSYFSLASAAVTRRPPTLHFFQGGHKQRANHCFLEVDEGFDNDLTGRCSNLKFAPNEFDNKTVQRLTSRSTVWRQCHESVTTGIHLQCHPLLESLSSQHFQL